MNKKWIIIAICAVIIVVILFVFIIISSRTYTPYMPSQEPILPPPPKAVVTITVFWREGSAVSIYDRNIKTGEVVYVNETVYFGSYGSQGPIDSYKWTISSPLGVVTSINNNTQIQYWDEGHYGFTLTVSNKGGSDNFSGSFDVICG